MRARDPGPARCRPPIGGPPRRLMAVVFARAWPPALTKTVWAQCVWGAGEESHRIGEPALHGGKCSGAAAAKAHTSRVRDPGRACVRRHRVDRAALGFGKSSRSGGSSQSLWGHSDCLETGTRLDVSVTAAMGAGRSLDGGGAALERRSLAWRGTQPAPCFKGTLRHRPTFTAPKPSSCQPAPLSPRCHTTSAAARSRTSPGRAPSRPHTSHSNRAASPFPRKRGMSPFHWIANSKGPTGRPVLS